MQSTKKEEKEQGRGQDTYNLIIILNISLHFQIISPHLSRSIPPGITNRTFNCQNNILDVIESIFSAKNSLMGILALSTFLLWFSVEVCV